MDEKAALTLIHLYLSKRQHLNHDINNIRIECQRVIRRSRRISRVKQKLVVILLSLVDDLNLLQISRRNTWSLKKMIFDGQQLFLL